MATKTYQLEHTYSTVEIFFIEAKSEEEAEQKFLNGECGEPDDFFNDPDDDEIEISEFIPDDEVTYEMDED